MDAGPAGGRPVDALLVVRHCKCNYSSSWCFHNLSFFFFQFVLLQGQMAAKIGGLASLTAPGKRARLTITAPLLPGVKADGPESAGRREGREHVIILGHQGVM